MGARLVPAAGPLRISVRGGRALRGRSAGDGERAQCVWLHELGSVRAGARFNKRVCETHYWPKASAATTIVGEIKNPTLPQGDATRLLPDPGQLRVKTIS
jgi:hypothetical protein